MGKWLARAHALAAPTEPANDAAPPAATPEQASELRELVAAILPDDAERADVLRVACADPEAALTSFRALVADPQPVPLPDPDDRRTCQQCANLVAWRCSAAARGELAYAAGRMYSPVPGVLRRCEAFAPKPGDPDQRTGRERWPELIQEGKAQ